MVGIPRFCERSRTISAPKVVKFFAVPIDTREAFTAGLPKQLFEWPDPRPNLPVREYDVAPDGPAIPQASGQGAPASQSH